MDSRNITIFIENLCASSKDIYRLSNRFIIQYLDQSIFYNNLSSAELSRIISVEWTGMTDEEKQPQVEEALRQKEAHQARLAKQMEDALEAKRAHRAARKTKSAKRD